VRCGTKLARRKIGPRVRGVCPKCEWVAWGNPKPTAGVLIERRGQVLLVRRERAPYKGYWDIPGGFVEAGEVPAKGAMREAYEETGLRVKIDRLVGIYADVYREKSGNGYTFNVYYAAHPVGGRAKAGDDTTDLRWFSVNSLPRRLAFPGHSRAAIREWRKGRRR
jgi:8-oxo-dGTP diphosphatase